MNANLRPSGGGGVASRGLRIVLLDTGKTIASDPSVHRRRLRRTGAPPLKSYQRHKLLVAEVVEVIGRGGEHLLLGDSLDLDPLIRLIAGPREGRRTIFLLGRIQEKESSQSTACGEGNPRGKSERLGPPRIGLGKQFHNAQRIVRETPARLSSTEALNELINWRWLFFVLLGLATLEWGTRKYFGGY